MLNSLQSTEPGPSRIGPVPRALAGLGDYPQRLDSQSSILPSGHSAERKFVEPATTGIKSRPVQTVHTIPVPRHCTAARTAPPTESVIDSTLDPPGPVAEERPARWSTFRSGHVDISLPPLSSRISSPEAGADPRPSINQTPAQVVGQRNDMPVVRSWDTNPHSVQLNTRANDMVPIRSMEGHRTDGSPSDRLRQHDIIVPARLRYPRSYSVLEDVAEVLPSPPDYSPLVPGFTSACGNLPLSLGPHDRPRRILHDRDFTYVVTAHGIIDQVGATSMLKFDRNIRSPSLPSEEFIDDACILPRQGGAVIVLGHAREQNQVTFLNLEHGQVNIAV